MAGQALAEAAIASGLRFNMLFGAAYKGIPLAAESPPWPCSRVMGLDLKFAYNRKEFGRITAKAAPWWEPNSQGGS